MLYISTGGKGGFRKQKEVDTQAEIHEAFAVFDRVSQSSYFVQSEEIYFNEQSSLIVVLTK